MKYKNELHNMVDSHQVKKDAMKSRRKRMRLLVSNIAASFKRFWLTEKYVVECKIINAKKNPFHPIFNFNGWIRNRFLILFNVNDPEYRMKAMINNIEHGRTKKRIKKLANID